MVVVILTEAILLLGQALELLVKVVLGCLVLKNLLLLLCDGIFNNTFNLTGILVLLTDRLMGIFEFLRLVVLLLGMDNLLNLDALLALLLDLSLLLLFDHHGSLLWIPWVHISLIERIHGVFPA